MAVESNVRKFLPQEMLQVIGKNLPGIIQALNNSHEKTEQLVQACIDQLFLTTASGRYLVQLGEEQGFTMPANSGLDIRSYRVLVPIMVSDPKQVRISIDALVKAFYGSDRVRANVSSSVIGPYSLLSGDDLIIETEKGLVSIAILDGQVSNLLSVTAAEIAAVLNSSQNTILAEAIKDRVSGEDYLRLITTTTGAGGYIKIVGGTLQNVLKFQTIVDTSNGIGTSWNITKDSIYTDITRITWNGAGTNPRLYLAKAGDVVTIRGLVDGGQPFSGLNGSYTLVDVGYDYFIIKNDVFDVVSSTYTQVDANSIVFTNSRKHILFDQAEYALTSETSANTITITVPAVPPLARRFLSGSAHLHGFERHVLDFTRNSLKIQLGLGEAKPTEVNNVLLKNQRQRYNFRKKFYKTIVADADPLQPTYTVDSGNDEGAALPYTSPIGFGTNPIYGRIGSDTYTLSFPFAHGLQYAWGFTLAGATGAGNVTAPYLNKEHQVFQLVNKDTVQIVLKDALGNPVKFSGIPFGVSDVYRHSAFQSDGGDFYLQFSSPSAALASGLSVGTVFRLSTATGVNADAYYGNALRYLDLAVTAINGNKISFSAGFGPGSTGLVISTIDGNRSGVFSGTPTYFLDKTTSTNIDRVFTDLRAIFVNYTKEINENYVGSYLYDPTGEATNQTVSRFVVKLTDNIQRGDNIPAIFVDTTTVNGEEFPQTGEIIVDYGTEKVEGPIRYFAVISNTSTNQILIDPAYKFKKSHGVNSNIQYIHENKPYTPTTDGTDFPFYITGTTESRNTLFELVELLIAAGIFIEKDIILPNLRYVDPALAPFE